MRAINSNVMKQLNRRMVLDCIRRKPISRAKLSDETQLTRASITQIVDSLMQDGLVVESAIVDSCRPGRKQTQLTLVKDSMYIAGIHVGNQNCEYGLMNLSGEIVWSEQIESQGRDQYIVMDEVAQRLEAAAKKYIPESARVFGLGICLPSPIDLLHAEAIRRPDIAKKSTEILAAEMKRRLGWDVYVDNVSNAFALDELYFGIGRKGVENFMVFRVDESLGVGFVCRGDLFYSARGLSPEIGHITLVRNGPLCKCGNRGCLEGYISIPAALKDTPFTSWAELMDHLDEDPLAMQVFRNEAEILAFEIVNLANVLDLDHAVISGDLFYGGQRLADEINRLMNETFVHRMCEGAVVAGSRPNLARIGAMPAYHAIFA